MKNTKRCVSFLLALSMLVVLLTACATTPTTTTTATTGGTTTSGTTTAATTEPTEKPFKPLKIALPYDPNTLDPANMNLDTASAIGFTIYEGLLRDVNGVAGPGAAEFWEHSEDLTEWTFVIRDGRFSDGSPITANDFYYAFMRTIDPEAGHANASSLLDLVNANAYYKGEADKEDVGIEVLNDRTIKLTFTKPMFETQFTTLVFSPVQESLAEAVGIEYGSAVDKVLCNGPFIITEWMTDSSVKVVKNEDYWDAASIHLDEIAFVLGAAGDTAVDLMLTGLVDIASFVNINQVNTLVDAGFAYTSITTSYRSLNVNHLGATDEMTPFMSNLNFRKALNLAVDRENLCTSVLTTDEPAFRLTAPSEFGFARPFHEEYPYEAWPTKADEAQAKAYLQLALDELDKTLDDVPEIVLLCFESESSVTILSAVQDMLKNVLGLDAKISSQTIGNMISMAFAGEYDLWLGGNSTSSPDWLTFAYGYHSESHAANPLFRGYTTPEFDALYNTVAEQTDYQARKDALFELEKYFCENIINLIVSWTSGFYVSPPDVENVYFRANGTPYYAMVDVTP